MSFQTFTVDGIKVEYSVTPNKPTSKKYTIETKRAIAKHIVETKCSYRSMAVKLGMRPNTPVLKGWTDTYRAGLYDNPSHSIAVTRRPKKSFILQLEEEVSSKETELKLAKEKLAFALQAEKFGFKLTVA